MKIEQHIVNLILNKGMAGLPGLGRFISYHRPAKIHPEKSEFTPPSLKITFKTNRQIGFDRELVKHYAVTENLKIPDAENGIVKYSRHLVSLLSDKGKCEIPGLGILTQDKEGVIDFVQDSKLMQAGDYFGLSGFSGQYTVKASVPAKSSKEKKRSKEKIVKHSDKKTSWRWVWWPVIILFLAGLAYLTYMYKKQVNDYLLQNRKVVEWGYALWKNKPTAMPVTIPSPQIPIADTNTSEPEKIITDTLISEPEISRDTTDKDTVSGQHMEKPSEQGNNVTDIGEPPRKLPDKYFVMAGVFSLKHKADRHVGKLIAKGYEARIFTTTSRGHFMVCYDGFPDKTGALHLLRKVKSEENPEAWLYERK